MSDLFHVERDESIDRRGFVRRLFAMGAGIAASGALVRAADAAAKLGPSKDAFEAWLTMYSQLQIERQDATFRRFWGTDELVSGERVMWTREQVENEFGLESDPDVGVIEVRPNGIISADPERLAQLVIDDCMENRGGRKAIAAAMLDDMKYGGHGRIVVGKDLHARYEPVPIIHRTRLVEPWRFRGRSIMDELLELNG